MPSIRLTLVHVVLVVLGLLLAGKGAVKYGALFGLALLARSMWERGSALQLNARFVEARAPSVVIEEL